MELFCDMSSHTDPFISIDTSNNILSFRADAYPDFTQKSKRCITPDFIVDLCSRVISVRAHVYLKPSQVQDFLLQLALQRYVDSPRVGCQVDLGILSRPVDDTQVVVINKRYRGSFRRNIDLNSAVLPRKASQRLIAKFIGQYSEDVRKSPVEVALLGCGSKIRAVADDPQSRIL